MWPLITTLSDHGVHGSGWIAAIASSDAVSLGVSCPGKPPSCRRTVRMLQTDSAQMRPHFRLLQRTLAKRTDAMTRCLAKLPVRADMACDEMIAIRRRRESWKDWKIATANSLPKALAFFLPPAAIRACERLVFKMQANARVNAAALTENQIKAPRPVPLWQRPRAE